MLGANAVRRYIDVMAAKGIPPEVVLSDSGLNAARISDPSCLITPAQYRSIVSRLIDLTGQEGIGLAVAAFRDLGDLGIVGHASAASRTVRDTYRVWTRFGPTLVGMMGKLQIKEEDHRSVTFAVASPDSSDPLFRFSVEELLTMVQKVSRTPLENAPSVGALAFSYAAPKHADRYQELFGCPLKFGAAQTTIKVWKEWFDRPSTPHDEEFNALCLQHCEGVLKRIEQVQPATLELQRLFTSSIGKPLPSLEEAAQLIKVSARTLRRRLHDEGSSYRAQLDNFRAEQAKKYLSYGTHSTKQIAYLLGFQEQSAFRHAFKDWTGMTVSEYAAMRTGNKSN